MAGGQPGADLKTCVHPLVPPPNSKALNKALVEPEQEYV